MDPAVRSRGGHPSALSVPRGGETVTEAVPLAACGDACDGAAVADGPCPEVPPPSPPMPAFAETHPRCMPCYGSRLLASPMVGVVFGLALLTFVPYVVLNPHMDTVALTCKVVLTALLSLMLASYVQCVWIDAGTVPNWWLERAETAPEGEYQRCRRTNLPKPPRSHYDSSTKRLVLNMDHFCPWVANTVGFYNRKFFVLFLIYTTLACCFAATTSVMVFGDMVFPSSTCKRTHTCTRSSLMLFAIVIDGMFGILLVFFAGFHVSMALTNETTIESFAYAPHNTHTGLCTRQQTTCAQQCTTREPRHQGLVNIQSGLTVAPQSRACSAVGMPPSIFWNMSMPLSGHLDRRQACNPPAPPTLPHTQHATQRTLRHRFPWQLGTGLRERPALLVPPSLGIGPLWRWPDVASERP